MSKRDKLRRKLRNNPKGVRYTEIETLLLAFGFILVRVRGSHHVFQYNQGKVEGIVILPVHGSQVKPSYVKDAVELIDQLFPEEQSSSGESGENE